jgi:hypothetical protein
MLMVWIVLVLFLLLLAGVTRAAVINARALWRDAKRPPERFRNGLERDANTLIDNLLAGDERRADGR